MHRRAWSDVRVACVWIAQLPLRVEILRHPAWDGRPLVLGGAPGERKVVQLCSPEAEAAGVRPGLPLREVVPLCPEAIVLQPDPVRTASVLEAVLSDLQRVSPAVEPADDGYFFLDLRGLQAMYGELAALEEAIHAAVPALLRPRLGFANGKFASAVAARVFNNRWREPLTSGPDSPSASSRWREPLTSGPDSPSASSRWREPLTSGPDSASLNACVVPASETQTFLAPLSVRHLLMLDADVHHRLELLGLRTIGDLAALPFNAVQAELGPSGARAWRLAHGKDTEPVVARPVQAAVQDGLRFDDPLGSVDAVMAAIDQLLAHTYSQPALQGHSVRQVRLRALP